MDNPYCCNMREKFVIGIVGNRTDIPVPIDVADFIINFSHPQTGKPVIGIKFCPFCGVRINHNTDPVKVHTTL